MTSGAFDKQIDSWREYQQTPWGRIRYAVIAHTLTREVERLGGGPLRILDVGAGDGRDTLPLAEAGHDVTIIEPSPRLRELAAATPARTVVDGGLDDLETLDLGEFDLVLCHFVLQYRPPDAGDLARLLDRVRPGGLLSLITPNRASRVLAALVREGPRAATEQLHLATERTVTFDTEVRRVDADDVAATLVDLGAPVVARYGGRIANDLLDDDELKHDPAYYAALESLELELCDREPFNRIGMFWQLVAQRQAVTGG